MMQGASDLYVTQCFLRGDAPKKSFCVAASAGLGQHPEFVSAPTLLGSARSNRPGLLLSVPQLEMGHAVFSATEGLQDHAC